MTNLDDSALLEWLAGLFPLRATAGRPVTVMFTDLVGFTAAAASHGDGTALRLLRGHDAAVLPHLRRHAGRMLKRLGDGLMAVFGSPAAAVAAALAMQDASARRPGVRLRIGIHTGPARTRAGDLVGHAVNVASRIADRAPGGGILVSEAVRSGAAGVPARFHPRRPLVVAGRTVPIFRVRP